jgi:hypothetical protein
MHAHLAHVGEGDFSGSLHQGKFSKTTASAKTRERHEKQDDESSNHGRATRFAAELRGTGCDGMASAQMPRPKLPDISGWEGIGRY